MEIASGKIKNITPDKLIIEAPYTNIERVCLRKYSEVLIGLPDNRKISPEQRRKAYALIEEISIWSGYEPIEVTKETTKMQFLLQKDCIKFEMFSLSNCSITTAREYITFLIDFIIKNNIPTKQPLLPLCEDINKYVYACLMNKVCAVCGKPAQLHHVERIGMGRNRNTINHLNMLVLPLCGKHHIECHGMPQYEFNEKYHLVPIKLTDEIGKKYNLSKNNLTERQA
ncbi:putative HNHc nuclease [Pectinatus frisingensis]|uniref:putative HNHc nuclease n=1 Tax=Pectinatus frisingensis TaxID=865 RepID=UPI0018C7BA49|nr:putative HNHc nuclease [Pectinatus frisingensis]